MTGHDDTYLGNIAKEKHKLEHENEILDAKKEIFALKQEVIHLKADVKYERELRLKGAKHHEPVSYHEKLREMIRKVEQERKITDLFHIVDEAQRRLRDEEK